MLNTLTVIATKTNAAQPKPAKGLPVTAPLFVKLVLVLLLVFILFNLARALFIMVKGENTQSMSRFLGRRVMFSAFVVILLLIAMGLGIIEPNPRPY
ncbi:DUF2909 domain-containing protein [Shewanella glacialimarina]|nr:DUF2909 domain-containing protein [Shewanella glacialimarina]